MWFYDFARTFPGSPFSLLIPVFEQIHAKFLYDRLELSCDRISAAGFILKKNGTQDGLWFQRPVDFPDHTAFFFSTCGDSFSMIIQKEHPVVTVHLDRFTGFVSYSRWGLQITREQLLQWINRRRARKVLNDTRVCREIIPLICGYL